MLGQSQVGKLEVSVGARPLLILTAGVALISFILAAAAFISVRVFPLRALDRATRELKLRDEDLHRMREEHDILRDKAEQSRRELVLKLADNLEFDLTQIVGSVSKAAEETESVALAVASSVKSAKEQASDLSQAARIAISGVQSSSASTEELTVSFGTVVRKISDAKSVAQKAVGAAVRYQRHGWKTFRGDQANRRCHQTYQCNSPANQSSRFERDHRSRPGRRIRPGVYGRSP